MQAVAALVAIGEVPGKLRVVMEYVHDQHQHDAPTEYLGHWQAEQK